MFITRIFYLLISLFLAYGAQQKMVSGGHTQKNEKSIFSLVSTEKGIHKIIADYLGPEFVFDKTESGAQAGSVLALSPNGQFLATGGISKPITIWDPVKLTKIANLPNILNTFALTYSPDSDRLVSCELYMDRPEYEIKTYDSSTGYLISRFTLPLGHVSSLSYSPDGQYIAIGSEESVVIADMSKSELKNKKDNLFSPKIHSVPTSGIYAIGFTPDGKFLISGEKRKIVIRNPITAQPIKEIKEVDTIISIGFLPTHNLLVYARQNEGSVWALNLETLNKQHLFTITDQILSMAIAPDGSAILVGDDQGNIHRYVLKKHEIAEETD